ncbi:MAG: type II toxin-antitoxin system VapC family toxin [Planctomycetaceae bacterium]
MAKFLMDTNHLGAAINPGSALPLRIHEARKLGHRFGTCIPVMCELEWGLKYVRGVEEYRCNLAKLLKIVRIWPLDEQTARIYGDVASELRSRGRVLSQVDMMVAAMARQGTFRILSTDRDFEALPDLHVENWLSPTT